MRYFLILCRILVGATFIVSGLVKANDPLGFSYKLEEYFAESALNWPALEPWSLALAMLACLGEVVLGFAILVGGRMRLATTATLVLTLFFGWLTAYTDNCNQRQKDGEKMTYTVVVNGKEEVRDKTCVTDCGCFGDAMKGSLGRSLTPRESFYKDLILFVFLLPVFIVSWRKPGIAFNSADDDKPLLVGGLVLVALWSWVFGWSFFLTFTLVGILGYLLIKRLVSGVKAEWLTAGWVTVLTVLFMWYCLEHLPMKDYRPFAVGKSIPEGMAVPEGEKPDVYETVLTYKNMKTGEVKDFNSKDYPWQDSTWVWQATENKLIQEGYHPPIHDFVLTDVDGVDVTEGIMSEANPVVLIVSKDITEAATHCQPNINALAAEAFKNGWYVYGVTASGYEQIEEFRHTHQNAFDYLRCDGTVLKTIIRSNPGVLLLQQGVVRGQWHCNDTPSIEEAKKALK
ncbi:MAG: DoxX family protein [Flavobacteriales bacterium]|nr:DoxX family protein [Flavobacteriales bacterium]